MKQLPNGQLEMDFLRTDLSEYVCARCKKVIGMSTNRIWTFGKGVRLCLNCFALEKFEEAEQIKSFIKEIRREFRFRSASVDLIIMRAKRIGLLPEKVLREMELQKFVSW